MMPVFDNGHTITIFLEAGADFIWQSIHDLAAAGTWTIPDLQRRVNAHEDTLHEYVRRLVLSGHVERLGKRAGASPLSRGEIEFRLISKSLEAPRVNRAGKVLPERKTDRLWRTMKMLKTFTIRELAAAAATEASTIGHQTTASYVKSLKAAGVLNAAPRHNRNHPESYRLALNLGARAPRILRSKLVYDPNANVLLGADRAEEVSE